MKWREMVLQQLPLEVGSFVEAALRRLEATSVFDAPGVISGVLLQMREAESDLIRAAAPLVEIVMRHPIAPRVPERVSA